MVTYLEAPSQEETANNVQLMLGRVEACLKAVAKVGGSEPSFWRIFARYATRCRPPDLAAGGSCWGQGGWIDGSRLGSSPDACRCPRYHALRGQRPTERECLLKCTRGLASDAWHKASTGSPPCLPSPSSLKSNCETRADIP